MTHQAIARMERYHRCRWLLLAVHLFASAVIAVWLSGRMGELVIQYRLWQDRKQGIYGNGWYTVDWSKYPVLSFINLEEPGNYSSPHLVNGVLTIGLIAVLIGSLVTTLRSARLRIPSRSFVSWNEAMSLAVPLAFLSSVPAMFISFVVYVGIEPYFKTSIGYHPPPILMLYMSWLSPLAIIILWLIWGVYLRMHQRRSFDFPQVMQWMHALLIRAGILMYASLALGVYFWGVFLIFDFALVIVLYWCLTALVWLAFHWSQYRASA